MPIPVPNLTITDNADGSGAVATINGSDAAATNTIRTQRVNGELGSAIWNVGGSRVGDGTINVSLANGYYWFQCASVLGGEAAVANLVYARTTSGDDPLFRQCLDAVQAHIQSLALGGIAGENVVVRKLPWNRHTVEPGIFITPTPETMRAAAGTNQRDDVGYGVRVTIVRASNQDLTSHLTTTLAERDQIARAFRQQPLTGVAPVYTVQVEPDEVVMPEAFQAQYDVSSLVLRCMSREGRGFE